MLFHVFADLVRQTDRKTVFVQRAVIAGEIHHMNRGRLVERLVILAVGVVHIGHMIPPRNVAVLFRGGFHRGAGLFFGESVKGQAGIVGKFGNDTPRCEKLGFVHKKTSFLRIL